MKIMLNGGPTTLAATTLAGAIDELGFGAAKVATAVNEVFVPTAARADQRLCDGDRVEILAPRQGG